MEAAVGCAEIEVLGSVSIETKKGMHSNLLPTVLLEILEKAGLTLSDLGGLVVGLGPGSFTGLRTGVATMAAMAFAARLPLVGDSSLGSMALEAALEPCLMEGAVSATPILVPVLDARRGQVYAGFYQCEGAGQPRSSAKDGDETCGVRSPGVCRLEADAVIEPSALLERLDSYERDAIVFGAGLTAHPVLAGDSRARKCAAALPSASALARLCVSRVDVFKKEALFLVNPSYVRRKVVQ